jgi:phosphatidylglycerophosphate synthase
MSPPWLQTLMSLPNLLSLSRIPLGGAFWLTLGPTAAESVWAFAVMAVAAVTDVLDGHLARRQARKAGDAQAEPGGGTGAWLDPICDKLFIAAVLAAIIVRRHPPPLLIGLILTRELVQVPLGVAYRFIPTLHSWLRYDFRASVLGKAATVAQFLAIAALILDHPAIEIFALIAFALGIAALVVYMRRAIRIGKSRRAQADPASKSALKR